MQPSLQHLSEHAAHHLPCRSLRVVVRSRIADRRILDTELDLGCEEFSEVARCDWLEFPSSLESMEEDQSGCEPRQPRGL